MKNITRNNGGLISRGTAGALVLLLVLTGWPAVAASNSGLDWSKVQVIKPGAPIKVVLHKDQGPRGDRKLRGRFQSATDDSLTLKMEYGPTRTLPRSAVRKVAVRHKSKRDWSRVQTVALGTPAAVVLYKNPTRRIKGYFYSATDDSVTLTLKDGQRHTFSKWAVRKVLVHRPLGKRYQGWITAVASSVGWFSFMVAIASDINFSVGGVAALVGVYIAMPTALAFAVAPKMGGIYNVPPKHRMQPPADKPSGDEGKTSEPQGDAQASLDLSPAISPHFARR